MKTASQFITRLKALSSPEELKKIQRYFKPDPNDRFLGVRMGSLFELAKEFIEMTPAEIEKLLDHELHEVRAGGLSIMDKQGRSNKTPESRRKELFDLYMRRSDRINNWDLVDLAAPYVVGRYLFDKPRARLYKLARSKNMWERRTAIVSTWYFIRKGETEDTFRIAEMLLNDREDLIHKAMGGWIRQAGTRDRQKLMGFLDQHAAVMPRTALRYAIEHLSQEERSHYMNLKSAN